MPERSLGESSLPLLRTIRERAEVIVVVCDAELVGKKFEQGGLKLDVKGSFYRGREASIDECLDALRGATIANLVGSVVEHAVRAGIVERTSVIHIQKIPMSSSSGSEF